jgi:hypothetical protein
LKRILTLIIMAAALAGALPAKHRSLWFHGAVVIGSINKEAGGTEFWAEIDIQNNNRKAETLELTVRRYNGNQVMHETYLVSPGEKRLVRIEDPGMNLLSADGRPSLEMRCTTLLEPAPPGTSITLRQVRLHGDQLTTSVFWPPPAGRLPGDGWFQPRLAIRRNLESRFYTFSNIGGKPEVLVLCDSLDPIMFGCTTPSERLEVAPFSTLTGPLKPWNMADQYLLITHSPNVAVVIYFTVEGTTSTFNAESSITFGGTVKEAK